LSRQPDSEENRGYRLAGETRKPDRRRLRALAFLPSGVASGGRKVEKSAFLLYKIISGGMMEKEFTPVSIPTSLYKKIEEKIKGTEFSSVSSYVTKVLRENLAKNEDNKEVFSPEEEEKIKERLKALGYID
jgi:Arc/MetJ-type ribon-helix-helix transcriptional regulator